MKTSGVCAKCKSTELYHSPTVMDRGEGNVAMALAIRRTDSIEAREIGHFEVFACRACGYSEFYVIDPKVLTDEGSDP